MPVVVMVSIALLFEKIIAFLIIGNANRMRMGAFSILDQLEPTVICTPSPSDSSVCSSPFLLGLRVSLRCSRK